MVVGLGVNILLNAQKQELLSFLSTNAEFGLATLCIGGGMGMSSLIELK